MPHSDFSKWWVRAQKEASTHLSDGYRYLLEWKELSCGIINLYHSKSCTRLSYKVRKDGYSIFRNGVKVAERNEQQHVEVR